MKHQRDLNYKVYIDDNNQLRRIELDLTSVMNDVIANPTYQVILTYDVCNFNQNSIDLPREFHYYGTPDEATIDEFTRL